MCQLLGMNCNTPTDIVFSFTGFALRGGLTDEHQDGWGIAFFEGAGVRHLVDHQAAIHSPLAELIKKHVRECWGKNWVFAHNGDLPEFKPDLTGQYLPIGNTDSERAFCYILQELRHRFGAQAPGLPDLTQALRELCQEISRHGTFNMMLSNGEALFVHCSTHMHYLVRQHPFNTAHLSDEDISVDFSAVTTPKDRVAVIATEPLTNNETWIAFSKGDLKVFVEGACLSDLPS